MRFIFIFLTLLLLISPLEARIKEKPKWKMVEVLKVVDNQSFMLKSQKVIKIIGIKSPSIYLPKKDEKCLVRPIYRTLENLLVGQKVKIFEDGYQDENGAFARHVKLHDGRVLTEFLLQKGLAKFDSKYSDKKYLKRYKKAGNEAKEARIGLWAGCNRWNDLKKRRKSLGFYPSFYKKYGMYLSSISVGRVEEVISGNVFVLTNGLKVELLGVSIPNNKNKDFTCFTVESKEYLEKILLDRKVFLVRDRSQFSDNNILLRYVYLAHGDMFVNKKVIQDGYGKSNWNSIDDKFKKEFERIQKKLYQNPNGAWKSCVKDLLERHKNNQKEPIIKLIYDEDCRIKGNISGAKSHPKKTYHTPASGWYKRLKHEKCFEREEEAINSGFSKIK